jgi:hypothetical protein
MATIDGWLEGYLHGPAGLGLIILVSLALGLRHASDPDHLAAVTTLIASEEHRKPARKAGLMGLLWGLGRHYASGLRPAAGARRAPFTQPCTASCGNPDRRAYRTPRRAAAVAVAAWSLPYPPPHLR